MNISSHMSQLIYFSFSRKNLTFSQHYINANDILH